MIGRRCTHSNVFSRPVLIARNLSFKPTSSSLSSNILRWLVKRGEDPPLPIPNREVKLTSADGTAPPGGRVGSCRFSESPTDESQPGFLRSGRSRHSKAAARCPISPAASQLPPGALRGEPLRHPRVASLLVECSIDACNYCILPVVLLSLLYAKGDFF